MFPYRSGREELAEFAGLEKAARHWTLPSLGQWKMERTWSYKGQGTQACSLHGQWQQTQITHADQ